MKYKNVIIYVFNEWIAENNAVLERRRDRIDKRYPSFVTVYNEIQSNERLKLLIFEACKKFEDCSEIDKAHKIWEKAQEKFIKDYYSIKSQINVLKEKGLEETFHDITKDFSHNKDILRKQRKALKDKHAEARLGEIYHDKSNDYDHKETEAKQIITQREEAIKTYLSQLKSSTIKYKNIFEDLKNCLTSSTT